MITSVQLAEIDSEGELTTATVTEMYKVRADGAEDANTVRNSGHPSLPEIGDEGSNGLVVTRVRVRRDPDSRRDRQVFYYVATWTVPDFIIFPENPLDRDPEIHWEGLEIVEAPGVDAEGTPYRNSAGDMYNPQPERIVMGGACVITRNEANNPADTIFNFSNTMNQGIWHGVPANKGLLGIITADKQQENNVTFWRVSYPIQFNRKEGGWRLMVIDNGFNELSGSGGGKTRITDKMVDEDGVEREVPRNIPSYLDGSGGKLPDGGTPVFYPEVGFAQQEETDWDDLDLPDPFA